MSETNTILTITISYHRQIPYWPSQYHITDKYLTSKCIITISLTTSTWELGPLFRGHWRKFGKCLYTKVVSANNVQQYCWSNNCCSMLTMLFKHCSNNNPGTLQLIRILRVYNKQSENLIFTLCSIKIYGEPFY